MCAGAASAVILVSMGHQEPRLKWGHMGPIVYTVGVMGSTRDRPALDINLREKHNGAAHSISNLCCNKE